MVKISKKTITITIGLLISAVSLIVVFWKIDINLFLSSLSDIKIFPFVLMVVIYLLSFAVRGARSQIMLGPIKKISWKNASAFTLISHAANAILPARLGEVFRAYLTGKKEGISKSAVFGSVAVEHVFDGLFLLGVLFATAMLANFETEYNNLIKKAGLFAGVIFFLALSGILVARFKRDEIKKISYKIVSRYSVKIIKKISGWVENSMDSVLFLKMDGTLPVFILYSLFIWLLEGIVYGLALNALNLPVNWIFVFFALAFTSIGLAMPSAPAYVGVFQGLVLMVFSFFGLKTEDALAYSVVVNIVMVLPAAIIGLILLNLYKESVWKFNKNEIKKRNINMAEKAGDSMIIVGFDGVVGKALTPKLEKDGRILYLINKIGIFKKEGKSGDRILLSPNPYEIGVLEKIFEEAKTCVHLASVYAKDEDNRTAIIKQLNINVLFTDFISSLCKKFGVKLYLASTTAIYYPFVKTTGAVNEETPLEIPDGLVEDVFSGIKKFKEFFTKGGDVEKVFLSEAGFNHFFPEKLIGALSPRSSYALSKYAAEQAAVKNLPADNLMITRFSNIFGPCVDPSTIIPKFNRDIGNNVNLEVFDWSRNFVYIYDVAEIFAGFIENKDSAGLINVVSPQNTISLYDLALFFKQIYPGSNSEISVNKEVAEPHLRFELTHKILKDFKFTSLEEGIKNYYKYGK